VGDETQKLEKQNPMRLWLERHLGKVILTSIPVVMISLAGWIYTIGNEIAVIKEKMKEDQAQWNALLTIREKLDALNIEVKVNQKLMYLMSERDIPPELLHLERLLQERIKNEVDEDDIEPTSDEGEEPKKLKKYGSVPGAPRIPDERPTISLPPIEIKPRQERLEDFKQQQIQQMAK